MSVSRRTSGGAWAAYATFIWLIFPVVTYSAAPPPAACRADILHLVHQAKAPSYAVRPGGSYCDGNVPELLAGEIELIDLSDGSLNFGSKDSTLYIARPKHVKADEVLTVRGEDRREKRVATAYRLDGRVGPKGIDIALTPAIKPLGLQPAQLGVVMWRGDESAAEYLPITASPSADVIATVRVPMPAIYLFKQICLHPSGSCGKRELVREQMGGDEVIPVSLARGDTTRTVRLEVTVDTSRGRSITVPFVISIPARQ